MGMSSPAEIPRISISDIKQRGGHALPGMYKSSLYTMAVTLWPENQWNKKEFSSHGFYRSEEIQHQQLVDFARKSKIRRYPDWYSVSSKNFSEICGKNLLRNEYNGSMKAFVGNIYKSFRWVPWNFFVTPKDAWTKKENIRAFADNFGVSEDICKFSDWRNVTVDSWKKIKGGMSFIVKDRNSKKGSRDGKKFSDYISEIYPEFGYGNLNFYLNIIPKEIQKQQSLEIHKRKRKVTVQSHRGNFQEKVKKDDNYEWDLENIRLQLDVIAVHFNIRQQSEWYNITLEQMASVAGTNFSTNFHGDVAKVFAEAYPQFKWESYMFSRIHQSSYSDQNFLWNFLCSVALTFHIELFSEWNRISLKQLKQENMRGDLDMYKVLSTCFPMFYWSRDKLRGTGSGKRAEQRWVFVLVKKIFAEKFNSSRIQIHENFKHPALRYKRSNFPMELDVFVPSFNLGFEYHGEHHFQDLPGFPMAKFTQDADTEKREACAAAGIALIEIPWNWNKSEKWLWEEISKKLEQNQTHL